LPGNLAFDSDKLIISRGCQIHVDRKEDMSNQGVDLGCLALQDPWCNFNNLKPKFEGEKNYLQDGNRKLDYF